jgi:hypothetical protein
MRSTPILSSFICLLIALGAFAPDAYGKKKKKRRIHQKTENVEEVAPGEMAPQEELEEEAAAPAPPAGEADKKSISDQLSEGNEGDGGMRRSNRMEFDERLVKGQAAKSGAVYLFKRVPRHLPGLVPMRRSYRRRIVLPVLGQQILKPARYSFEVEKELKLKRQKVALETGAPPPVVEPPEEPAPEPEEPPEPAPEKKPAERNKKKKKK